MHTFSLRQAKRGFTIVEVIVVLVVIAILAAITITSYTAIQNRTRDSNAKNNAQYLQRKLQAYFTLKNTYPATPSTATTTLNAEPSSNLKNVVTLGTPTSNNGERTIKLELCTAGGVAYRITYWDFINDAAASSPQITGGPGLTSCTTWAVAT